MQLFQDRSSGQRKTTQPGGGRAATAWSLAREAGEGGGQMTEPSASERARGEGELTWRGEPRRGLVLVLK